MLNELGLQSCHACVLCGRDYGKPGQPPHWRRPILKVDGEGSLPCEVLFLGEAPGADEDLAGRPFIGTSGKLLRDFIHESGLDQVPYYITNTVKCRPPGNRKPTPAEASSCRPWLDVEIEEAQPRYIICLGDTAMRQFFASGKVKGNVRDWVGKVLPLVGDDTAPTIAIGCYHPAARQASQRASILTVMQYVAGLLGIQAPEREQVDYRVEEV